MIRVLLGTELNQEDVQRVQRQFPEIEFVTAFGKEQAALSIQGCEVMLGSVVTSALLERADALKWIHTRSAGVNSLPFDELSARGITVTNSSGAHGIPIAENTLAMMLAFATGLHIFVKAQVRSEWNPPLIENRKFELEGQSLLVLGLGDLGETLARKAKGLGMTVRGIRRTELASDAVDETIPLDDLLSALSGADHVALCLPLTPYTTGFFGVPQFKAMKPTAYLYNAGRGKSVDREALLTALQEGWIAGAGLDTTDPEPIPPDDPLWQFPNVILTQHTSGSSPQNSRRVTDLFIANLRNYMNGGPLRNLVDLDARY